MKNLTGSKFHGWTVLGEAARVSGKRFWFCQCECGIVKPVMQGNLTTGKSKGCMSCSSKRHNTKHGMSSNTSGLYNVWKGMKNRCLNPSIDSYKNYGGRGITVCESWLSFENFLLDMGVTYRPGLTLDRVDNDKGYSPSNCRWATRKQQNSNTRRTLKIEYRGGIYNESELSLITGVKRTTIQQRRKRGLSGEDLVR